MIFMDEKLNKAIEYYSEMVSDLKTIIYDYVNDKFFDDVRNTASFKDLLNGYREELEDKQNLRGWLKELKEMRIKDKESQRPKGKWIKCKSRFGVEYFKCSECGRKLNWIDRDDNYCNICGSDNSESTKEWFKEWDTKLAEMSGGEEE